MTIQLQRLYYADSYLESFEATIVDMQPTSSGWVIELDKSAFYPTSGGQPHDEGEINGLRVVDVFINGTGQVGHLLEQHSPQEELPLTIGQAVLGRIDLPRRRDHMQHHTGQHILSACFEQFADADTIGFHLGREDVTIDVNNPSLDSQQINRVEDEANEIIRRNLSVKAQFIDNNELSHFRLRKRPQVSSDIRIVSIGEFDDNACGGTHVRTTAEVGLLKILKTERMKKGLRVHFLCGTRAFHHYRLEHELLTGLGHSLSAGISDIPGAIEALQSDFKNARKTEKLLRKEIAALYGHQIAQTAKMSNSGLYYAVAQIEGPYGAGDAKSMAATTLSELQQRVSNAAAAVIVLDDKKVSAALVSSPASAVHCGNVLKDFLQNYGGKGGGNAQAAQGSLTDMKRTPAGLLTGQLETALCQC